MSQRTLVLCPPYPVMTGAVVDEDIGEGLGFCV